MVPRPLAPARAMRSCTCADVIQPCLWWHNVESTCWANRANFPPLSRSTAHALKTFSAEEPWVLE